MDIHGKSLSWFGNVRDKFDSFRSDIDSIINQVPLQYAENQLFTAGANIKQFCSEFMEEMLPESIINSLKEKTSPSLGDVLRTDVNEGPIKGFSDDSSPSPMEVVEDEHTDSPLGTGINVGKELCFEEIRIRETTFPFEISHVEAYYHDDEYTGHEDLPQSPSATIPAKEWELSDPINRPSVDLKIELSTVHSQSSILPAKEREVSDPFHTEKSEIPNVEKDLSVVLQQIANFENDFLKNQVSSLGHKVKLPACKEREVSDSDDTEISDLKKELSAIQILDNSNVTTGLNDNLSLENQVSPLGHKICEELIYLNDGSGDNKAEETKVNQVANADMDIQSFRTEMIEGKCIMPDSGKFCLTPDLPEENHAFQRTVCKSCLAMKFDKECECKKAASSIDGDAESDQFGGKSLWLPLLRGESDPPDQDFCESDWVIV